MIIQFSSVQFSRSVLSHSLRPHEPQHARPPCPSPTPGVHPNPCPLSQWCHPAISSSVIPFSSFQPFPVRVFSNESALRIRWPKHWSFSFNISPTNEHPGLIFNWLVLKIVLPNILFIFNWSIVYMYQQFLKSPKVMGPKSYGQSETGQLKYWE